MSAKLVFLSGGLEGVTVSLLDQNFTIGRNPDEDLVLPDEVVSRRQATLRYRDGQYTIRDEDSTNGTFVNDRRIDEQVLQDGDVIEYGLGGPSARFDAGVTGGGSGASSERGVPGAPHAKLVPRGPRPATAVFQAGGPANARPVTDAGIEDERAGRGRPRFGPMRPGRLAAIGAGVIAALAVLVMALLLLLDRA